MRKKTVFKRKKHTDPFIIVIGILMIFFTILIFTQAFKRVTTTNKKPLNKDTVPHIWPVRSIETMSQTKDKICNQPGSSYIKQWVQLAKAAGATHITYSGFYDSPHCGNAISYSQKWEKEAHDAGLNIWWRQMFTSFEGIDKTVVPQCNAATKGNCNDYITMMVDEIKAHKEKYKDGDIFSITAEPAASRIRGVTCNHTTPCVFESATGSSNAIPEFNQWMVKSVEAARKAFKDLGVDVTVNGGGLDLFVAVGYRNPDWGCDNGRQNILYPETVQKMGGMVLDHYFDSDVESMQDAINAINRCYPESQYPDLRFHLFVGPPEA